MNRNQVHTNPIPLIDHYKKLDERFHRAVIAIGNFDGMHLGHRQILAEAREHADRLNCSVIVLTFEPHPRTIFFPENPPKRLASLEVKHQQLALHGCDCLLAQNFDEQFASISAEEFVSTILRKQLKAQYIVVGENFRFGSKQTGDVELLRKLGEKYCFGVSAIPLYEHLGEIVSSTRIRSLLRQGQIHKATALLGRPETIEMDEFTQEEVLSDECKLVSV